MPMGNNMAMGHGMYGMMDYGMGGMHGMNGMYGMGGIGLMSGLQSMSGPLMGMMYISIKSMLCMRICFRHARYHDDAVSNDAR
uniref:Uncharacterized protein n=1 Tax=Strongyloides papillosus TaxID=174720 RepID=A0A0N5BUQ4_STREA